jgi:uncharacterized OB-fold protein
MSEISKPSEEIFPAPEPDATTAGYWAAALAHRFSIQHCHGCGRFQHFPAPWCSACGSADLRFDPVSGKGTVYSFVVVHHVVRPWFKGRAPYAVAWVELPEQQGLRVLTDLVDVDPNAVWVGMPVEVIYDDVLPELTIPRFRPA